MNTALIQTLRSEIEQFKIMTEKFLNKEITMKEYKGYSGGFGAYGQRGGDKLMLRLRMNQGVLTKDKLAFIIQSIKEHHLDHLHITTCQTVQLHDLGCREVVEIMDKALDHDIVTRGGGGDFPRNVMCSPLSGVEKGEYFNVLPYAKAVGDYLIENVNRYKLPRKLKVAFSNSKANVTHATFRDLGFVANEDHTFDVYSAGGLGNNPKMGLLVAEHIDPTNVLYYVQAMIEVFMEHGNYDNRAKARTRYMQETMGEAGYSKAYQKKAETILAKGGLHVQINEPEIKKQAEPAGSLLPRMIEQKQKGLYAVSYHPIAGGLSVEVLQHLYDLIKDMDDVEIRIAPDQTMYLINLTAKEAQQIVVATQDGAATLFEHSVACVGAGICQVGLRDSHNVLIQLIQSIRPYGFKNDTLPKIHISGCTSSCSAHQIAGIGFQGTVKVVDKKPLPAFIMTISGNEVQDQAVFGEVIGTILEDDLSKMLIEIGKAVEETDLSFKEWIRTHKHDFLAITAPYTA